MKQLLPLVKALRPGEIRLIKHFLRLESNAEVKKRSELFDLILSGKVQTDQKALKKLYKTSKNNSAYSHLKERLRKDVLNILFLQDASKKFSTKYANAEFECRRNYIQADILIARGAYLPAIKILERNIQLADKYELAAEKTLTQQLARTMTHRIKSEKKLEDYNTSIRKSLELMTGLNRMEEITHYFSYPQLFKANKMVNQPEFKINAIQELKGLFEKTNSPKIGFWYHATMGDYYTLNRKNAEALENYLQFLKLIEKSPSINSQANLAGANMNISSNLISLMRYDESVEYAKIAVRSFRKGGVNQFMAMENLFFAYFRNKSFDTAEDILKKVFEHPAIKANAFYPAKWLYLRACLEFSNGEFSKSLKTLNESSELNKDKSGWLLGLRMLELLIMVEIGDFEWFDFKLENFRKLLQRQKEENVQRSKVIFNVLKTLSKMDFDYFDTFEKENKNIQLLEEAENELQWDPKGFEVIRFDDWIKSKVD